MDGAFPMTTPPNQGIPRSSLVTHRTILKMVAAAIYFVIDALALSILKPLCPEISQLKTHSVYRVMDCFIWLVPREF